MPTPRTGTDRNGDKGTLTSLPVLTPRPEAGANQLCLAPPAQGRGGKGAPSLTVAPAEGVTPFPGRAQPLLAKDRLGPASPVLLGSHPCPQPSLLSQPRPSGPQASCSQGRGERGTGDPGFPSQHTPSVPPGPAGGPSSQPPASRNPSGEIEVPPASPVCTPIPGAMYPALPTPHFLLGRQLGRAGGPFSPNDTL